MYDTDSMIPLLGDYAFTWVNFDWINNKCYSGMFLHIRFSDDDSTFDNMKSITCATWSLNPRVNLTSSIVGNVVVLKSISKHFVFYKGVIILP